MISKKFIIAKAAFIISMTFIVFSSFLIIYKERIFQADKIKNSKSNAEAMVNILADYTELNLSYVSHMIDDIEKGNLFVRNNFDNILRSIIKDDNYIDIICYIKNDYSNKIIIEDKQIIKNNEYLKQHLFEYHKKNNIKISKLKFFNQTYIVLSKTVLDDNNGFLGVIAIGLKDDYLDNFFESINLDQKIEMALLTSENQFLYESDDIIATIDVKKSIIDEAEKFYKDTSKTISIHKLPDNYLNIFAFKHLETWPISIALVSFEGNILKNFLLNIDNLNLFLILAIFILIIISYSASVLIRYFENTQKIERLFMFSEISNINIAMKILIQNKTSISAAEALINMLYSEYLGKLQQIQKNKIKQLKDWIIQIAESNNDLITSLHSKTNSLISNSTEIEINKIFNDAIYMFEDDIYFKKIKFDNLVITPYRAKLDRLKILQILINLIEFVLEYASRKSHLTCKIFVDPKGNLVLQIINNSFLLSAKEVALFFESQSENYQEIYMKIALAKFLASLNQCKIDYKLYDKSLKLSFKIPNHLLIHDNNKKI